MALQPIYSTQAAVAALPLVTRSVALLAVVGYVVLQIAPGALPWLCLNPHRILLYGQLYRLFLYPLLHTTALQLLFGLLPFLAVAPELEAALGSLHFMGLLAIVNVLIGLSASFVTVVSSLLSMRADLFWFGCAVGLSGMSMALLVIWVYSFTTRTRLTLAPGVTLPATLLPPLMLLASFLAPSSSFFSHNVAAFTVGLCYVQGWLKPLFLSNRTADHLEAASFLGLLINSKGFAKRQKSGPTEPPDLFRPRVSEKSATLLPVVSAGAPLEPSLTPASNSLHANILPAGPGETSPP